jgi:hypothetical protein
MIISWLINGLECGGKIITCDRWKSVERSQGAVKYTALGPAAFKVTANGEYYMKKKTLPKRN